MWWWMGFLGGRGLRGELEFFKWGFGVGELDLFKLGVWVVLGFGIRFLVCLGFGRC